MRPARAVRTLVCVLVAVAPALTGAAQSRAEQLWRADPEGVSAMCLAGGGTTLPVLPWTERSDWINVRKDVKPAAVGDGHADDTAALQAAIARIGATPGKPKVVYFPPGTYRITKTLVLTERNGAMLVGHGAKSMIRWAGAKGGRMFWSNGAPRSVYLGLVWDGANIAGVGIDHDSRKTYETRVRHQYMEFRGFRTAGIRVGHDQVVASAEMMFYGLVFRNNRRGVQFLAWNDYNNVFDRCEFSGNGTGIHAPRGNVVVRNTRFERSAEADVFLSTHSHSLRRVVSVGSRVLVDTVSGPAATGAITVQDCHVRRWTNPDGAILSRLRGPLTVFDCEFAEPPTDAPPVRLAHPAYMNQTAIVSNIVAAGASAAVTRGDTGRLVEIPAGKLGGTLEGDTHFLPIRIPVPSAVFDVRTRCGAKGNLIADDRAAIQRCLDDARDAGGGVMVYFPTGYYRVGGGLRVQGGGYSIGGSGFHSQVFTTGTTDVPLFDMTAARDVRVEHLAAGGPASAPRFFHGPDAVSRVRYDGVYGWHDEEGRDGAFEFRGLPPGSVIVGDHLDGNITLQDAGAATVLPGLTISRELRVGGTASGGFLGALSRVSCCAPVPLTIRDNHSFVMTDWYNEQSAGLLAVGGAADAPSGHVTLDVKKAESEEPVFADVDGYDGRVSLSGGFFGIVADGEAPVLEASGGENTDVVVFGSMFRNAPPEAPGPQAADVTLLQNIVDAPNQPMALVDNVADAEGMLRVSQALDDYRELGALDALLNLCVVKVAAP